MNPPGDGKGYGRSHIFIFSCGAWLKIKFQLGIEWISESWKDQVGVPFVRMLRKLFYISSYIVLLSNKYGQNSQFLWAKPIGGGLTIEGAWKSWVSNLANRNIKSIPLIINWGAWLARNASIFKYLSSNPKHIVAESIIIFSHFSQGKEQCLVRFITEETVNTSNPWDFFDGASQNDSQLNGCGDVLHLSNTHFFNLNMGSGPRTNNYVELMALKLLLTFIEEKGFTTLHIFGDSMIGIKWIKRTQRCHNIRLLPFFDDVLSILALFESYTIRRVYKERNMETDALSKAGLQLNLG